MKTYKTPPTNEAFFNEHAGSYRLYGLIGWMGQFLSFASLAYGIYSMVYESVHKGNISLSSSLMVIIGLATAFIIEFANRALGRRAIKPFVTTETFDGEALEHNNVLNKSYLVGLVVIGLMSYLLSGIGSVNYGEKSTAPPTLINLDSIQKVYAAQISRIDSSLVADNQAYIQPFEVRINQAKAQFQKDSLLAANKASQYNKCAKSGKDKAYCRKKQQQILANIPLLQATRLDSINAVELEKAKVIAFLRTNQKGKIQEIEQKRDNAIARAELDNKDMLKGQKSKSSFRSMIFLILTVVGQSLFYYMTFLQLRVEAGSGIKVMIKPDEFFLKPSVFEEWAATFSWKWGKRMRNMIEYAFNSGVSDPDIQYEEMEWNNNTASEFPAWLPEWIRVGYGVIYKPHDLPSYITEIIIPSNPTHAIIYCKSEAHTFSVTFDPVKPEGFLLMPGGEHSPYDDLFDDSPNGTHIPSAKEKGVPL